MSIILFYLLAGSFLYGALCGISYLDITAVFVELTMTKSLKDDYVTEFGGDMIERVALVSLTVILGFDSLTPLRSTHQCHYVTAAPQIPHSWNAKPLDHTGTHQC